MNRSIRYLLLTLLWGAIAAYVVYAAVAAQRRRMAQTVERLKIEVVDSTAQGYLVSAPRVEEWIARSGIATIGAVADQVDLAGLEQLIARNGFVEHAKAFVTGDGTLRVVITPRRPLLRFLADGFDCYVTAEGRVFAAPQASSLYVPVVTGPYRPPFPATHAGPIRDCVDDRMAEIERRIAELEIEKYPFFRRERTNDANIAELRRMRVKRRWWRLERDSVFERRREQLRETKTLLRRRYRYEARLIREGIAAIERKQQDERQRQKKLEKSYEDFLKLLTFVEDIEDDAFWRSEVVQIVARTTSSGALELDLVPRSGDFRIRFGRIEEVDRKFDKLLRFYRNGLSRAGWGAYRTVDVRYDGQVVCTK